MKDSPQQKFFMSPFTVLDATVAEAAPMPCSAKDWLTGRADSGGMSNTYRLFPSQGKPIWKFWSSVLFMAMCIEKGNNCSSPCSLPTSQK